MQASSFFASMALLVAAISAPVLAGDHDQRSSRQHASDQRAADAGFDHRMKVVANEAAPEAPAYGWRYFSDPTTPRAVVISPQGDYYYSRGKGLRWIAAEQI